MPPEQKPPAAGRFQFRLRTLFIATAVAALLAFCFSRPVNPLESLLGIVFGEETFYGPGYTEFGWRRVRAGMTKAQVLELLGDPLTKGSGQQFGGQQLEVWEYTSCGPSECYYLRQVHFSKGVVTNKLGDLYVD